MTFKVLTVSPRVKCELAVKANAIAQALDKATPEQISNWVDSNITGLNADTLAALRKVIKFLLLSEKSK